MLVEFVRTSQNLQSKCQKKIWMVMLKLKLFA